jgi:3-isopropylmalate/(R)-2-methylmalate dehydratase small subunit
MEDYKRIHIKGTAIPVRGNDIDTDRIIPARFLKCVVFDGLGEHAFEDDRIGLKQKGQDHPFDQARFQNATVLFVNKNFGCGSSREHAPQSLVRWNKGIQAIIGESFAEIFFGNCISLGVPCVTVEEGTIQKLMDLAETHPNVEFHLDVEKKKLFVEGEEIAVTLADGPQSQFLTGRWDSTAELLTDLDAVSKTAGNLPYFHHWK